MITTLQQKMAELKKDHPELYKANRIFYNLDLNERIVFIVNMLSAYTIENIKEDKKDDFLKTVFQEVNNTIGIKRYKVTCFICNKNIILVKEDEKNLKHICPGCYEKGGTVDENEG